MGQIQQYNEQQKERKRMVDLEVKMLTEAIERSYNNPDDCGETYNFFIESLLSAGYVKLDNIHKENYIIPKGDENNKEQIILHNLICRDADVSDCEEADKIAEVIIKAGYVRKSGNAKVERRCE